MEEKKKITIKEAKPKGTIPLVLKSKTQNPKPDVEELRKPVGMFEIEKTMKELGPMLKDPKTKDAAEKKLKALHDRMRKFKKHPKW